MPAKQLYQNNIAISKQMFKTEDQQLYIAAYITLDVKANIVCNKICVLTVN